MTKKSKGGFKSSKILSNKYLNLFMLSHYYRREIGILFSYIIEVGAVITAFLTL